MCEVVEGTENVLVRSAEIGLPFRPIARLALRRRRVTRRVNGAWFHHRVFFERDELVHFLCRLTC
jgi:hypothetical protein